MDAWTTPDGIDARAADAVPLDPTRYWDTRARRFARTGAGLAAVCSYGMPAFYNGYIDLTQRLALAAWLLVSPGTRVLDVGCGIGRWSRALARAGALVTGVDLAPSMADEAYRRAAAENIAGRCRFLVGDLAELDLAETFDLVLAVTVLQHITEAARFEAAVSRLAAHLAPAGRLVLLEAAPDRPISRCDHAAFRARDVATFQDAFARAGLRRLAITGVDPVPLKTRFLPWYRRLPRPLALTGLAAVTALSLPVDVLAGRRLVRASWHKVFVLTHAWG